MENIDQLIKNYRFIDLSHTLQEGTPGFAPYIHYAIKSRKLGDFYNSNIIQMTEHHGTHVDAPIHVGGKKNINEIPIHKWHGLCNVIDLTYKKNGEFVWPEDIQRWIDYNGKINGDEIVLLSYGWDKQWAVKSKNVPEKKISNFYANFPGLSEETAKYLGNLRIKLIGTDTPTIDAYSNFERALSSDILEPAHKILLIDYGIVIMECLKNLDKIPPKGAYLFSFPLKIHNGSGSPVRAIALISRND